MKTTLDWYKHDATASESPKFIVLRASPYGWAGEARFWALNGLIARADDCKLDLTRKFAKAGIADKLDMTVPQLDDFLTFLRDECELVEYQDGVLWTSRLNEDLAEVMAGRESAASRKRGRASGTSKKFGVEVGRTLPEFGRTSGGNGESSGELCESSGGKIRESEEESEAEAEQSAALYNFALERAKARGALNPEAMARAIMDKPDIVHAYMQTRPTPDFSTAEPTTPEEIALATSPEAMKEFTILIDKIMAKIGAAQEDEF